MSEIKNGGPAFPVQTSDSENGHQCTPNEWKFPGMSLRDYFAAKAMQAIIRDYNQFSHVASDSYQIADAMLVERERTKK
jgi:hypothetical protein